MMNAEKLAMVRRLGLAVREVVQQRHVALMGGASCELCVSLDDALRLLLDSQARAAAEATHDAAE